MKIRKRLTLLLMIRPQRLETPRLIRSDDGNLNFCQASYNHH